MLRLLIVLLVVGLALYFTVFQGTGEQESTMEPYREQTDKARQLEQQMQDTARERMEQVEEQAR